MVADKDSENLAYTEYVANKEHTQSMVADKDSDNFAYTEYGS